MEELLGEFEEGDSTEARIAILPMVMEYLCEFVPPRVMVALLDLEAEGDPEQALTEWLGHQPWWNVMEGETLEASVAST